MRQAKNCIAVYAQPATEFAGFMIMVISDPYVIATDITFTRILFAMIFNPMPMLFPILLHGRPAAPSITGLLDLN